MRSYISTNGINMGNIRDSNKENNGIFYFNNTLNDSKWALNIQGAKIKGDDFFEKFKDKKDKCLGIIATTSQTIKMPL